MKKLRLNRHAGRAFQGSSRGFVLLEAVIAIAILGIIGVTFLGALSTTSTTLIIADERTTAESLAKRQIEYIKSQVYSSTESVLDEPVYQKIGGIPAGYSMWSVNRAGAIVTDIVGIPWDSRNNRLADKDDGLQKIALVIKHNDKVIFTFSNDDDAEWAPGVKITLEAYKVNR